MILDLTDEKAVCEYENFIKNFKFSPLEQSINRAKVKNNRKAIYFYDADDQGKIDAALSVLYIKDQKAGKNFFYAPRGPVVDYSNIEKFKKITREALEFAKENDGFLLRCDPFIEKNDPAVELFRQSGFNIKNDEKISSQPSMNSVLEIKGRTIDEIFSNFSKNTRKHVRSSYRKDLKTIAGDFDDLDDFFEIMKIMSERKGINYRPKEYFKRLYKAYEKDVRLTFTELDGEFLCASFMICYGDRCFSIYGASNDLYRNLNQNYQINYEEVKYAADNGYEYYDMGGLFSLDDDLYGFKRKFTEENVKERFGRFDFVLDRERYEIFSGKKNAHFERLENEPEVKNNN